MKRTKSFKTKDILYLIATPIGNLQEMSERALHILEECDIVAAEDTRNANMLLSHFDIHKKTFSLREHNETVASKKIVEFIKQGQKVVYMSDAGYPGISDPGYGLVKEAIANDIAVSTISGSSAFINALVASGLPTEHFYFYGFLSPKENEKKKEIDGLKDIESTIIFYESPHRIKDTLKSLYEVLGERQAVVARELTKINEEYIRGTLKELCEIDSDTLIGEMVIIIEGQKNEEVDDRVILDFVGYLLNKGISEKTAIEITADTLKIQKNRVKKLVMTK